MSRGKYCRNSRLVFSFVPRCQGLCGSEKYTFTLVATVNALCLAISNVWSAAVLQAKNEGDRIGLRECIRP